MAAETPQTDMSAEITMFKLGESIFRTRCPNQKVLMSTTGVTIQEVKIPGGPSATSLLNKTSAPRSTKPNLMSVSPMSIGRMDRGTPTVLLISNPRSKAHSTYS